MPTILNETILAITLHVYGELLDGATTEKNLIFFSCQFLMGRQCCQAVRLSEKVELVILIVTKKNPTSFSKY